MEKQDHKYLDNIKFYRAFFKSKHGEKVLYDLMKTHNFFTCTFVKGDRDEMLIKEGERNVVLRILSILKIDPQKLEQMMKKEEEENRDDY